MSQSSEPKNRAIRGEVAARGVHPEPAWALLVCVLLLGGCGASAAEPAEPEESGGTERVAPTATAEPAEGPTSEAPAVTEPADEALVGEDGVIEVLLCGCGCCGRVRPQTFDCVSTEAELRRLESQDRESRGSPSCANRGCSGGRRVRVCTTP